MACSDSEFNFSEFMDIWWDTLDGGSARLKASTYTGTVQKPILLSSSESI